MAVLAVFDQEWGGGSWYWMHGRRCRGRDANGSVFASSEHIFPRLFPAIRNSRTGTTAARILSIKTFSSLS